MTTRPTSLPSPPWSRIKLAGLLWGGLTGTIAILGGLLPALGLEGLPSAASPEPALPSPVLPTPEIQSEVPAADGPVGAEARTPVSDRRVEPAASLDELVDVGISVRAGDLSVGAVTSDDASQAPFTAQTVALVAAASAIVQADNAPTTTATSTANLARQSQNPIANLISIPLQNNTSFGAGLYDRTSNLLNIQPVIPTSLNDNWTLINRAIIPLVYQPKLSPLLESNFGLGDIFYQGFFSPKNSGSFTWGIGPAIQLPTATDEFRGTGKWSIGPAAVGLVTSGPIVTGALVNNIWSFAGDDDRPDVNQLTLQPFFNYNFQGGWYVTTSPIITANWIATEDQWTVPIGGGFGRVFRVGRQPVNASISAYWNAIRPDGAPEWTLRTQLTLLFPK